MNPYYKYLKYKQKYLNLSKGGTYDGYGHMDSKLDNNDDSLYNFSFSLPNGYGVSYSFDKNKTIQNIYEKIINHMPNENITDINIIDSNGNKIEISTQSIEDSSLNNKDSLSVN